VSGAQHTPGPWTVDDGGIRCDHEHNYGIVAQVHDGHIYSEYTSDSATLEFANIADMHLVAAAPELFEACELAIPNEVCLTNRNIPDGIKVALDCTMGDLRKIAAALAKARGETL
jgi:hypothetical protein